MSREWKGWVAALALVIGGGADAAPKKKPIDPQYKMPELTPAQIDDALAIGGEDIDAKKVRSRMTVAVQVNGKGPYRFVVDSGADSSVVGTRMAKLLQLPAGRPVLLNGMTESRQVDRVLVDSFQIGESTFSNMELPALREDHLGGDGMIGIDALVEQRLMMDFEKRTIKVEDAQKPAARMDGEIVVTARRRRGQLILTQVTTNKRPVDAVIDTGSEITIGNLALRDRLWRKDPSKFETIGVTGVTGVKVDLQIARVAELRVGTILMRDVPIAFAEVPPFAVCGLSDQPAMLLGTDILETFRRVSLDFRARKVRFQLKRCARSGIAISTAYRASLVKLSADEGSAACAQ